jgi:RHS repeat-associated protein
VEVFVADSVVEFPYAAFGAITESTGSATNPYRFSSKPYDENSGLSYFGRRHYSASLGRFITQDPKEYVDGLNTYAYVRNNPVNGVDLLGLVIEDSSKGEACSVSITSFSCNKWEYDVAVKVTVIVKPPEGTIDFYFTDPWGDTHEIKSIEVDANGEAETPGFFSYSLPSVPFKPSWVPCTVTAISNRGCEDSATCNVERW